MFMTFCICCPSSSFLSAMTGGMGVGYNRWGGAGRSVLGALLSLRGGALREKAVNTSALDQL